LTPIAFLKEPVPAGGVCKNGAKTNFLAPPSQTPGDFSKMALPGFIFYAFARSSDISNPTMKFPG
jgi:hypothetical protein